MYFFCAFEKLRSNMEGVPATMKAAVYEKYGASGDVLKVVSDRPVPTLGPRDVLIRARAASVNPVDFKVMHGYMRIAQLSVSFPLVPLLDGAGVVVARGPACTQPLAVGDEVMYFNDFPRCDCAAEYVAVEETFVVAKPRGVSFEEAAAVPLVGVTSYLALVTYGRAQFGSSVVVVGASGGTGTTGVQIAKALGCQVTAVCSGRNADFVRELGADKVVDYTVEDWGDALPPASYDIVYDCVGGRDTYLKACRVLKPAGRFVTIAGDKQGALTPLRLLREGTRIAVRKAWSWFSAPAYYYLLARTSRDVLLKVAAMVDDGRLKPVVAATFPLDDIVQAFAAAESNRTRGKNVVVMASSPAPPLTNDAVEEDTRA
jgi:NADPH:quinone reductase-like Zn-dependent oxidoreductase